jgi:hypothetical protein
MPKVLYILTTLTRIVIDNIYESKNKQNDKSRKITKT